MPDTATTVTELTVTRCEDFDLTGRGDHPAWNGVEPVELTCHEPLDPQQQAAYRTTFRMLWSSSGVYAHFDCADVRLSATPLHDFENLFTQDVVELFLWPSEHEPLYFEYNLSPFASELAILVPNLGHRFYGWRPWHYAGDRRCRKATQIRGGAQTGDPILGWSGELFIPTALLAPMRNIDLEPGVTWRANAYRIDYDDPKAKHFQWCDTQAHFHDYPRFGRLRFV